MASSNPFPLPDVNPAQPIRSPASSVSQPTEATVPRDNTTIHGSSDDDHGKSGRGSDLKHKLTEKKHDLAEKKNPPGGFDSTPLPDFPPGFTIKITFHKSWNLPIGDVTSGASDPFVHATLTADVPRRHKEDPVLKFRTRTLRKTLEPEWEQEWVVANIPRSGFRLKCRLYDEDYPDADDRLGNVTFVTKHVDEHWEGLKRQRFEVKKRMGSKRAYFLKAAEAIFTKDGSMTPLLELSIEVLGPSDPPGAQMYTVAPTAYVQHFSPMIGRLMGIKVNKDEHDDHQSDNSDADDRMTKRYDFQANEMQLQGPVPPKLYHRYVEFKPFVGPMFSSAGLRGKILNKVLHKQHRRIYNYDSSTKYGTFPPCSEDAAKQFLQMAHFDEGGRIFTYVLTLDGLLRFTETGNEFGIDMLSKHTMHSDVETYIACSGEFFIRRKKHKRSSSYVSKRSHSEDRVDKGDDAKDKTDTHGQNEEQIKNWEVPGPSSLDNQQTNDDKLKPSDDKKPPRDPGYYDLIIDNDSGTYRPDKSILPLLKEFLEHNLPGLGVTVMHCEDETLKALKAEQHEAKKKTGPRVRMVLNRSPSASSISSSDESMLSDMEEAGEGRGKKTTRERAWDVLNDPNTGFKELKQTLVAGMSRHGRGASKDEGKGKKTDVAVGDAAGQDGK